MNDDYDALQGAWRGLLLIIAAVVIARGVFILLAGGT